MLIGEFDVSIDEKSRFMIPAKIRAQIDGDIIIATKGLGKNLRLFTPEKWKIFSDTITKETRILNPADMEICYDILAAAHTLDIDKMRRIVIPSKLKDLAGLKKDALILGLINFVELWDVETYTLFRQENKEKGVAEESQKRLRELNFF